jgi:transposase
MKECALRLWESGWECSDICSALCVSKSSLYRWAKIFEEFGQVTHPPAAIRGRPRIICLAALTAVKELYQQHPDTYLAELQWFLAIHHDIAISISALQKNLEAAGLTRKILHKIATERDEQLRAEYQNTIQTEFSGTGKEFVFIDKSSKNEHDVAHCYGHSMVGNPADIQAPFVHGTRYSLVAALSMKGYIATRVLEGSYNADEFFDFIVEEVVCLLYSSQLFAQRYITDASDESFF